MTVLPGMKTLETGLFLIRISSQTLLMEQLVFIQLIWMGTVIKMFYQLLLSTTKLPGMKALETEPLEANK